MKKAVLILSAVLGMSSIAGAQGFFIGGSLSTYSSNDKAQFYDAGSKSYGDKEDMSDDTHFHINPIFGYSLNDSWEIGAELSFDIFNAKLDKSKDSGFGAGLYGRRYFDLAGDFSWFVEAGAFFEKDKDENFSFDTDGNRYGNWTDTKSLELYAIPGITYSINDHWSLDMLFNFLYLSYSKDWNEVFDEDGTPINRSESNSFNFYGSTSSTIQLSLYYCF